MYENFKKFTMLEDQPTTASDSTGNTDGEETNIDMLTRRVINHLNDYAIKGVLVREDVNNMVIESRLAQKELASLREQLATEQDMRSTAEFANRMIIKDLNEKLKQKEDENRELLDSISQLIYAMNTTGLPWNTDSTAEKAYANCRSLLKKHIG